MTDAAPDTTNLWMVNVMLGGTVHAASAPEAVSAALADIGVGQLLAVESVNVHHALGHQQRAIAVLRTAQPGFAVVEGDPVEPQ
jgi:hypothetical protein